MTDTNTIIIKVTKANSFEAQLKRVGESYFFLPVRVTEVEFYYPQDVIQVTDKGTALT